MNDTIKARMELDVVHNLCNRYGYDASPHIVRVLDTMSEKDSDRHISRLFIRMELCEGTLERYLKDMQKNMRFVEQEEIFTIMIQILAGLRYCHSKGYVHRDLKPSNGIGHPFLLNLSHCSAL
jgi:serine/threonine protein kinase